MTAFGHHSDDDTEDIGPLRLPGAEDQQVDEHDTGAPPGQQRGEVDLIGDPFADDLADELAAKAPRRIVTRSTIVLAALTIAVGGFLAGAQVQKHWGKSSSQTANPFGNLGNLAGGANGFPSFGAPGQASAGAQAGTGSASTTGTVKLVDGTTVYIQTADGTVVTVKTSGTTAVQVSQAGTLKDLKVGATVSVDGQTATDGSVTATKITKSK
jgi:hypothetical protein